MRTKIERMLLAKVPKYAIIRWDEEWGVVLSGKGERRKVDFWQVPPELVSSKEQVEVLVSRQR